MQPKQIDQRKISGQLGINLIERIALKMGFAWHPTNSELDAGIDGYIELRDAQTGAATNNILQVQSKALKEFTNETASSFEYLCKERDIEYWLAGNAPVILVISRVESDEAYWVSVKEYFADTAKKQSKRVIFNKALQKLTENSRRDLFDLSVPAESGLYFSPIPRDEVLYSNLIPVTYYPPTIYTANTTLRFPSEVWSRAKELGVRVTGEWRLKNKQIISFHNLKEPPWDSFCEQATCEANLSSEWALADDDLRNDFINLLWSCLKEKLWPIHVAYNKEQDAFYFRATPSLRPRKLRYASLKKSVNRSVFAGYESKTVEGRTAYYRHSAFQGQFRRFDGQWYLEVTPTYFFSSDGKSTSRFSAERLSGIKRLERNAAVLGQLRMWITCLTEPTSMFDSEYPFLKFGVQKTFPLPCGIDDNAWLKREETEEKKVLNVDLQHLELFQ